VSGRAWVLLSILAACSRESANRIEGIGTVEVREYDIAPQVPARVLRVLADEGDVVRAGDTLVTLSQSTTRADLAGGEARLQAAEAALREARAGPRSAEIQRAEAELRVAEAEADRTARDLERVRPLAAAGTVSRQTLDAAQAAAAAARGRRGAASESLRLLRQGTRPERLEAARAEVASARAALAALRAVAEDLVLTAQVDGTIVSRNADPGEVVPAGRSVLTLAQAGEPYVWVYVGTRELPRIRRGQRAAARLDGYPDRPIPGAVVAVSPEAEFTPRVALTERERADLMFGVKVALTDTTGLLHPGLPVTVVFEPVAAAP